MDRMNLNLHDLCLKMQNNENHFSTLQSALNIQNETDGSINFFCSDGTVEVKSTYLKLHSKLLSKIIPDLPFDEPKSPSSNKKCSKDYTVLLPDVPKSHISHLMNLITIGKSKFSVIKLSAIETISDVINDVLSTADLLDIRITNYGFNLEDEILLAPNPKPKQEYCEIPDAQVKKEKIDVEDPLCIISSNDEEIIISDDDDGPVIILDPDGKESYESKRDRLLHENLDGQSENFKRAFLSLNDNSFKPKGDAKEQEKLMKRTAQKAALFDASDDFMKRGGKNPKNASLFCACFICGEKFNNLFKQSRHQFSEHWPKLIEILGESKPAVKMKCQLCLKEFSSNLLGAHILSYHRKKNISVTCPYCVDLFSDLDTFYRHMITHIPDIRSLNPSEKPLLPKSVNASSTSTNLKKLQKMSEKVASALSGPASAKPTQKIPRARGLKIPTVSNSGKPISTWLGSDLLNSTGQAAFPPGFSGTPGSNLIVSTPHISPQVVAGWGRDLVPRPCPSNEAGGPAVLPPLSAPGWGSDVISPVSSSVKPVGWGQTVAQAYTSNKEVVTSVSTSGGSDTPVFGKSLSLLKSKSIETFNNQTNNVLRGSSDPSFAFRFGQL